MNDFYEKSLYFFFLFEHIDVKLKKRIVKKCNFINIYIDDNFFKKKFNHKLKILLLFKNN